MLLLNVLQLNAELSCSLSLVICEVSYFHSVSKNCVYGWILTNEKIVYCSYVFKSLQNPYDLRYNILKSLRSPNNLGSNNLKLFYSPNDLGSIGLKLLRSPQ